MASVLLTLFASDSRETFELEADAEGRFRRTGLRLGRYELSVPGEGDERWTIPLQLTMVRPILRVEVDIGKLRSASAAYKKFRDELVAQSAEATRLKRQEAGFARRHNFAARRIRDGEYQVALDTLDLLLEEEPGRQAVVALRASALAAVGRTAEAIDSYRTLIAADPQESSHHNNLGLLLAQGGQVEEAIGHIQQAMRSDKQRAATFAFNLGSVFFNAGRFREAGQQYGVSIKRDPTNPNVHYFHGLSLLRQGGSDGDRRRAISSLRRYLQLEPDGAYADPARDHLAALSRGDADLLLPDVRDREDLE